MNITWISWEVIKGGCSKRQGMNSSCSAMWQHWGRVSPKDKFLINTVSEGWSNSTVDKVLNLQDAGPAFHISIWFSAPIGVISKYRARNNSWAMPCVALNPLYMCGPQFPIYIYEYTHSIKAMLEIKSYAWL